MKHLIFIIQLCYIFYHKSFGRMKKFILLITLIIPGTLILAQDKDTIVLSRPVDNVNVNLLGGDGSLISINYEHIYIVKNNFFLSGKGGLGYNREFQLNICIWGPCEPPPPPEQYVTIPHHITGNLGKKRHFLEFGLGGTIVFGNTYQHYYLYPLLGYRIQPLHSDKHNFRIFGSLPIWGLASTPWGPYKEGSTIMFLPFGLSMGICF